RQSQGRVTRFPRVARGAVHLREKSVRTGADFVLYTGKVLALRRRTAVASGVNLLTALEHSHQSFDPLRASLRLPGGLHPEDDREPVGRVQRLEEAFGRRIRIERALELFGDLRGAGRIVGSVPSAIGPGGFDRAHPGRAHPSA